MNTSIRVFLALSVVALSVLTGCGESEEARRKRLTAQFVACVPDNVTDQQRREITGLLETFWSRAGSGEVYEEDVVAIESRLLSYVEAGRIEADSLAHLMALVGYNSYRKDPRYNLPERIVDHPTLNPDAAILFFGRDSSGVYTQMYYRVPEPDTTSDKSGPDTTRAPSKKERPDPKGKN